MCLKSAIDSHRADITLIRATRAYAAFCGEKEATEKHLLRVVPLVLEHRKRLIEHYRHEKERRPQREDLPLSSPADRDFGQGHKEVHFP